MRETYPAGFGHCEDEKGEHAACVAPASLTPVVTATATKDSPDTHAEIPDTATTTTDSPDRRAEIPDPDGSVIEVLHAVGTPDDECYHILPDGSKSETMPCPPADSMDSMPGSTMDSMPGSTMDSMPGSTVDCVVPHWCSTYPPEIAKEKPECQCPESCLLYTSPSPRDA